MINRNDEKTAGSKGQVVSVKQTESIMISGFISGWTNKPAITQNLKSNSNEDFLILKKRKASNVDNHICHSAHQMKADACTKSQP